VVNFTSLEANETHLVCEEKRVGWGNTDPNDGFDIINGQICQEVPDLQYAAEVREVVFGNIECNITVEAGEDKMSVEPTQLNSKALVSVALRPRQPGVCWKNQKEEMRSLSAIILALRREMSYLKRRYRVLRCCSLPLIRNLVASQYRIP